MATGDRHVETGLLSHGCKGLSLHMDDGGIWQLDISPSARRYLGHRVTIEGVRAGFDVIDVICLRLPDDPPAINRISLLYRLFGR